MIYRVLYIPGGCLGFLPSTVFLQPKGRTWEALSDVCRGEPVYMLFWFDHIPVTVDMISGMPKTTPERISYMWYIICICTIYIYIIYIYWYEFISIHIPILQTQAVLVLRLAFGEFCEALRRWIPRGPPRGTWIPWENRAPKQVSSPLVM